MREYVRPMMTGETFATNEYVAACWYIACDYGQGDNGHRDPIDRNLYHNTNSDGTGCGHADNQVIRDISDGMFAMREEDGFGEDYDVLMTRNESWLGLSSTLSGVQVGETIYWTTTASDGRIWRHKGQVETTSNVNRS